ncbi:hypothetical protein BDY19DRAFT_1050965 [Irpex rosettiformis]|uniref:Uncharacterized protein n=1 Tax=Irpex rosettiformis TaxID=378272 RepID=A0ACB8TSD0_9APHY|nr:hypothetical protein BDY19DRAFT_1050965 [Irpex rosettiformis]
MAVREHARDKHPSAIQVRNEASVLSDEQCRHDDARAQRLTQRLQSLCAAKRGHEARNNPQTLALSLSSEPLAARSFAPPRISRCMASAALIFTDNGNHSFVINIDDTSPTISYSPFADTFTTPNLTAGWNPYYSDSGIANGQDTQGEGTTFHVTSANGASLDIRWNGTAVTLHGFFDTSQNTFPSSTSYSVSLDGVPTTNYASSFTPDPNSEENVLAAFANLTNQEHSIQIALHTTGDADDGSILLRFDRAVLQSEPPDEYTTQPVAIVNYPDDLISFHGQWSFDSHLLPNQSVAFHTSTNVGDSASLLFNGKQASQSNNPCLLPASHADIDHFRGVFSANPQLYKRSNFRIVLIGWCVGTAVLLSGLTTPLSGSYNISLDNTHPPTTFSAHSSFNASSPTVLFYATGLDPAVVHELQVVNIGTSSEGEGSLLVLGSVNVTTTGTQNGGGSTPVASMSSRLPRGTIAAIVVGVRRQESRRKESFIVNPRVYRRRFSSFLSRPHPLQDNEKSRQATNNHADASHDEDVLDITAAKDDDSDDEEDDLHGAEDDQDGQARHGSQNSDGSYAIDLPKLPRPGSGHIRLRSDGESPSPTQRYSDLHASGNPILVTPSSPLRSPKPKGPREMRAIISSHGRDSSRGILLKDMYSPAADVPTDVHTNDTLWPGTLLPQPNVSPLRVNFEDELSHDAERRREARHRSETSGVSLPYSLKQALLGHIRPSRSRDVSPAKPSPTDPRRYSFLDLESSNASSSSRSNRQSQSTSTRSSLKARSGHEGSDQSDTIPPVPRDPRVSMGLSMTLAGGPTSSRPSDSPNISLQAVSLSPITIPDHSLAQHIDLPAGVHPIISELPSPTESIPMTVSDIHFRHSLHSSSSHVSESRRTSHRMSNPQRVHPPLPTPSTSSTFQQQQQQQRQQQQVEERPYIVQKILGIQTGSGPSTPFGSPTVPGFASRWSRGRGSGGGSGGGGLGGPSSFRTRTGPS